MQKDKMIKILVIIFGLSLLIAFFLLPVFVASKFGLLFVLSAAIKWNLLGGLISAAVASFIMMLVFFFTAELNTIELSIALLMYFFVAAGLGKLSNFNLKQRENLLLQKERYENILQATHAGTWEWNVQTGELIINERWAEMIGYTVEELSPVNIEKCKKFTHPDDLKAINQVVEKCFNGEMDVYSMESRIKHKEGHWIYILTHGRVISWTKDGKPLWMIGARLDITANKQIEKDLYEGEKKYHALFEQSPLGIYLHDLDGFILEVNETACKQLGYSKDELTKMSVFDLHPDKDNSPNLPQDEILHLWRQWQPEQRFNIEGEHQKKDGTVLPVQISTGLVDYKGESVLLAMIQDMTEHKKAEEARQESEKRLNTLISQTPVVIYSYKIFANEPVLTYVNDNIKMMGFDSHDFMENPSLFMECLHPEDIQKVRESVSEIINEGQVTPKEFRFKDKKGEYHWFYDEQNLFEQEDGTVEVIGAWWDITDRKEMEEELRKSKNLMQSVFHSIQDGISVLNSDLTIKEVNKTMEKWYQHAYPFVGKKCYQVYQGRTEPCSPCPSINAIESKRVCSELVPLIGEEKKEGWLELYAYPLFDDTGNIDGVVEFVRNISQRKMIEEQLQKSENNYRTIFNSVNDAIFIHDIDTADILDANKSALKMYGCNSKDEMVGSFSFFTHTAAGYTFERAKDLIKKTSVSQPISFEWQGQKKDGEVFWVEVSLIRTILDEQERILAVVRDISERKMIEEVLRKSEERYHTIFDLSPVGIMIEDDKGKILEVNHSMCEMSGYKKKEMEGKSVFEVFVLPEHVDLAKNNIARILSGEDLQLDIVSRTGKGELQHKRLRETRIPLPDGNMGILSIHVDITAQKKAEEKLHNLTKRLNEEITKASQIHERILPSNLPDDKGVSFAAFYQPAKEIGGDFYEVISVSNKLVFYLSDISGHGLDSTIVNFFVKHTIKGFLSFSPLKEINPENILRYLTVQFQQENYPEEYFICIFIGVLDLDTMEMTYSGAGFQDTPYVQMGNGEQIKLHCKGLFISPLIPEKLNNFQQKKLSLTPGTTIFFNTDGLTEQNEAGKIYRDRLPKVFYENSYLPPQLIANAVVEDFRQFNSGSLQGKDDITFLVIQTEQMEVRKHRLELSTDFNEIQKMRDQVFHLFHGEKIHSLLGGLNELVANAMEHGNQMDPEKKVILEFKVTEEILQITIEDQGEGFDWKNKIDQKLELEGATERGRGITMVQILVDGLYYNDRGNQATLIVKRKV